jgi:hypothetical protein
MVSGAGGRCPSALCGRRPLWIGVAGRRGREACLPGNPAQEGGIVDGCVLWALPEGHPHDGLATLTCRLYPASARRTLPRPSSMTTAASSAAAAPKAKVAPGPTALHSSPPIVLALKLASPVAV